VRYPKRGTTKLLDVVKIEIAKTGILANIKE
jgi:hypothetical protein